MGTYSATRVTVENAVYKLHISPNGYESKEYNRESVTKFRDRIRSVPKLVLENENEETFYAPDITIEELNQAGFTKYEIASVFSFLGIVRRITVYKGGIRKNNDIFANIHSRAIRGIITDFGTNTRPFIEKLIAAGYIDCNFSYQPGVNSTGYRISNKLRARPWKEMDFSELILSFPEEYCSHKVKKVNLWKKSSLYFTDYKDLEEGKLKDDCRKTDKIIQKCQIPISPELKNALEAAATARAAEYSKECATKNKPLLWKKEDILTVYYNSIADFNAGKSRISIDQRTGRMYSAVSNIKREARKAIEFEGKKLVSLDVRAMQFSLLATLYQPEDAAEKEKFVNMIQNEDIYTYLADGKMSREEAKISTFVILFAKTYSHKGTFYENFASLFPILAKRVTDMKMSKGFRAVSRLLQETEANIMINLVLNHLLNEVGIPVLTCHDSVACLPKDLEIVEQTMRRFFFEVMGFYPVIKFEG